VRTTHGRPHRKVHSLLLDSSSYTWRRAAANGRRFMRRDDHLVFRCRITFTISPGVQCSGMPKTAAHPGRAVVMIGLAQIIEVSRRLSPRFSLREVRRALPLLTVCRGFESCRGDHEDQLDRCLTSVNLRIRAGSVGS
jgi:hypothetical protein